MMVTHGAEIADQKWFFTQHRYNQLKKALEKEQIILNHDGVRKRVMLNFISPP